MSLLCTVFAIVKRLPPGTTEQDPVHTTTTTTQRQEEKGDVGGQLIDLSGRMLPVTHPAFRPTGEKREDGWFLFLRKTLREFCELQTTGQDEIFNKI